MDKKTLHQLIRNNIEELETLVNSFANIESHTIEVKLIYSKLQILKDEIEILAKLEEVKVKEKAKDKVEDKALIETIDELKIEKEVDEAANSKVEDEEKAEIKEKHIVSKVGDIEKLEEKEEKKDNEKEKIIIKSSKPKKERIRRRIERVKKEVQREIEAENEKIIEQAEEKTKEAEKEIKEPYKRVKKGKTVIVADKFEVTKQSINDILANSKKTKDLASMLKDKPITDLKKGISINDKIRFTKELFDGKSDIYQNAIDKLNNSTDLDEALDYLNKNFVWDQEKESFREFLELVYRRFVSK